MTHLFRRLFVCDCLVILFSAIASSRYSNAQESLELLSQQLESEDRKTSDLGYRGLVAQEKRGGEAGEKAAAILDTYQQRCDEFFTFCAAPPHGSNRLEALFTTKEQIPLGKMKLFYSLSDLAFVGGTAPEFTDAHLRYFAGLPKLYEIDLQGTKVSGAALADLDLSGLHVLRLAECQVDEKHLLSLQFSNLRMLDVRDTKVTNKLLKELQASKLTTLHISGTQIDKAGLAELGRFKELRIIQLDLANLSAETLIALIALNPKLGLVRVRCAERDFDELLRLKRAIAGKMVRLEMHVAGVPFETWVKLKDRFEAAE